MIIPPEEGELVRQVRVPECFGDYGSVADLLKKIDLFLSRCLDLKARLRFLMSCFVRS